MNDSSKKQVALSFLKSHSVGTLATLSSVGPHARTVYYVADDQFRVFFFTLAGTRKVVDINGDRRVAFVVSDEAAPQTLQMEGELFDLPDTTIADPMMKELLDTLMQHGTHFAPLTHMDASTILFYQLSPSWVRWGDFTTADGSDEVFSTIVG